MRSKGPSDKLRGRAKTPGKWLCLSSDQQRLLWLLWLLWLRAERRGEGYFVQVETWLDQAMAAKPIKLIMPEGHDAESFNQLLVQIMAEQQKFSDGPA